MAKKIITSVLSVLFALNINVANAQDSGTCGTNLVWILTGDGANKTLTITGTGAMTNYSGTNAPWYSERQNIKTLVVDNSVTTIGYYAFNGCEYITSATIGIVVTTIGDYAFSGCSRLPSITIPDNITSVGTYAFQNCTGLTTINFNAINCTTMSSPFYQGCQNITTLNIGSNVTQIPDFSFKNCTGLTSVVVPNNVTTIGSAAFGGCSSLVDITLPFTGNTVSSTAQYGVLGYIFGTSSYTGGVAKGQYYSGTTTTTFYLPASLRNVTITGGTEIKYGAFSNCTMLTSVTMSNSLQYIRDYAFYGCTGLTNITIPDNTLTIGNYAFSGCNGLLGVTIPSRITSIGNYAFQNCTSMATVNFNPTNCTTMSSTVFNGCANFTTLNIGNNVTRIPDYAFYGCNGITNSIAIPSPVTYIGSYAFYNCSSIVFGSLTISEFVTSIGGNAFQNCKGISAVNFDATNCTGNPTAAVFSGCTNFATLNIANNVTRIPNYIFDGCNNITSTLTVPQSVIYIGNYAFNNCSKMVSQNLPLSFVNRIGDYSFYNCMKLNGYCSVKDTIGNYAFGLCIGLDSVNIPSTAKKLGDDAFFSCLGLKTINYNAVNCQIMGSSALPVFSGCSGVTKLNIANDVTRIPDNAFYSCSGLTSVDIPASVTYVGSQAFKNCTGLTSMFVPNTVTRIGDAAFSGCAKLVDITLPFAGKSISNTTILADSTVFGYIFGTTSYTGGTAISQTYKSGSSNTFYLPNTLRNVTITNQTYLKYGSFYNCNMLTNITLPSNLQQIREYAFYNCAGLTSATIPSNVTTISNYAFQNCTGLKTLNYNPTNCTTNGGTSYPAFQGCTNLAKINVGNNVTRIQDYSFKGCTSLDSIISFATNVPAAYTNSFNGLNQANIAVLVPCNTLSNYQSEFGWQDFSNMTENCDNYTITVSAVENGQISPSGNQTVAFGQNVTFTFTPDVNYGIDKVLIDGVNNPQAVSNGSYTFERVNANHTVSVTFKKLTYTITVSAGENGTISPADNQTVEIGDNITFTMTPESEYDIYQVLIDGVNNPTAVSAGSYTFENVSENHTISVSFILSGSVAITTVANNTSGTVSGGGIYARDAAVTLTAIPNINTVFTGWNDGNTDNPRTVTATANLTFTANFESCNTVTFMEQIESLQNEITDLNNQITILQSNLSNCNDDKIALNEEIVALREQLTECLGPNAVANVENQDVEIYPNPAKEEISIKSDLAINRVEICDLAGQQVGAGLVPAQHTGQSQGSPLQINVSSLPAGVYLFKIHTDNELITKKFVKE